MGTKRFTTVFCVFLLSATGLWGADEIGPPSEAATTVSAKAFNASIPSSTEVVAIEPWIHPRMNDGLRARLDVAFKIAARRVQEVEACSELFAEIGADAAETLGSALYWPVLSYRDRKELCRGRNLAFTFVGSPITFICPDFDGIPDQRAAQVIIHEALHTAGLKERPQYSGFGVKTPTAIDSMVARACRF